MRGRIGCAAFACAFALASGAAVAGRTCEDKPLDAAAVQKGMALAERVAKRLDQTGADVVVIGRAGQDLGAYGIRWSHMAFAYRDPPAGGAASRWRVVHELNHCGAATSAVYRQGIGEFFMDRPFRYESVIVVLDPAVQAKLLPLLRDNSRALQWHTNAYNMLAYPWSLKYQQSNQWLLETLAGAEQGEAGGRREAQAWLREHRYEPAVLHLGPMTRLGARMTRANVAFDDHPNAKRFSDHIETVTVDSALAWLRTSGIGGEAIVVR